MGSAIDPTNAPGGPAIAPPAAAPGIVCAIPLVVISPTLCKVDFSGMFASSYNLLEAALISLSDIVSGKSICPTLGISIIIIQPY